ncbi:MAG: ParB N-terminal domain-containing protein [Caulobacteraceae bacterium]|nr:ParB N-terminal domain-containing protein [Caulobacteraceae bacterium]
MIEPNILAFQNAAVLDVLADPAANAVTTIADLAKRFERDPDNFRKTLKRLQDDGLLQDPPLAGLTDAGRDQLAAFKRAVHGGERRKSQGRWPLDRFRRNPLNRAIDPEAVLGLADTIVGVGDILMPLVVSAPDADGIRTIWAGERRWMAATRLAQMDQLPEALLQGLPFTERAADKGEAAVITLIENGARSDLTPWDDARQLRIAADETGLNATELARRIGRARDGDRGGVRDVQVKIKVAREATPEAVAAYEADPAAPGAWEALRDSVSKPRPKAEPEIVLTRAQRLALAELAHKAGGFAGDDVAMLPAGHTAEGARLAQYDLAILTMDTAGDRIRITQAALDYLHAEDLVGSIESIRERLGFPAGYGVSRYQTAWLNTPVAAAHAAPDAETRALQGIEPITTASPLLTVADFGVPADWRGGDLERAQTWIEPDSYEAITLLNPKPGWRGGPDAEITLARVKGADAWVSGYSYWTGSSGSNCSMNGIWNAREPAFRTREEAILDAAKPIRQAAERDKAKGRWFVWLDNLLVNDPLVVNGVRYPNAARAGEARRALGLEKTHANYGGGERRAPSPDLSSPGAERMGEGNRQAVEGATADPLAVAAPQTHATNEALRLIALERARQVVAEGWSPEHDDGHAAGELARAAASYAFASIDRIGVPLCWPETWDPAWFKPTGTIRDLVKAGALIAAEIERRHRVGEA